MTHTEPAKLDPQAHNGNSQRALPEGVSKIISFGSYRLLAKSRQLERAGLPVPLGDRALDILRVLTERAGEIVTHSELLGHVWGKVVVGQGSLRFHINALRKILAQDGTQTPYIRNVPRRGYVFTAPVRAGIDLPEVMGAQAVELGKLPQRPADIVGRASELKDVIALLNETRFVTVVGSGGVGKTTVVLEAAHSLCEQFDRVSFVSLETVTDPAWVSSAVAAALGLAVSLACPVPNLLAYLRDRKVLLIFDSCERVPEAAAILAEQILERSPQSAILATSQEALRANGEHVYILGLLEVPSEGAELTPQDALQYPAIELFVTRARAALPQFKLTGANLPDVVSISRSVDGIPLAIELAAGRVSTLALPTIAKLLNSQFALTWPGRRTAPERHRTMGGAIAWTVELLDEQERTVLRRLAVFSGPFTLEAAQSVAGGGCVPSGSVAEALSNLVARSLVSSSGFEQATEFALLGVTRAFAGRMLEESGESQSIARRHALFVCEFLERTYSGAAEFVREEAWRSHAAWCLANLRSALDWALSQEDDTDLLVRLSAAAGPFLLDLSLLSDCARWAEIGLQALEPRQRGSPRELELRASLGFALFHGRGSLEQARSSLNRALQLAEEHRDPYNQLRLLGDLNFLQQRIGDLYGALRLAERAQVLARSLDCPACLAMANWLLGTAKHAVGDQLTARRFCERAWSRAPLSSLVNSARFGFDDLRLRALCALVRSLWLLGKADEARGLMPRVIEEAERFGHPIALGLVLVGVTQVWLWMGDWDAADACANRLIETAEQHSMRSYNSAGRGFQGQLAVEAGNAAAGIDALLEAADTLQASGNEFWRAVFAEPLAQALAQLGRLDEALAAIDSSLKANEGDGESFYLPEVLRVKGLLLQQYFPDRHSEARDLIRQSFGQAGRQGALAWQLRAAISLSRQSLLSGHEEEAHRLLRDTYGQFSEGFGTRDLILARQALAELEGEPFSSPSKAHIPAAAGSVDINRRHTVGRQRQGE